MICCIDSGIDSVKRKLYKSSCIYLLSDYIVQFLHFFAIVDFNPTTFQCLKN